MKTIFTLRRTAALVASTLALAAWGNAAAVNAPRWVEALDRGAVAVPATDGGNLVSWRLLAGDAPGTTFDVYRDGKKVNAQPLAGGTNLLEIGRAHV